MSRTISVMVKKSNTMNDKSAALGILQLTDGWSKSWKSFTGSESGFGKFAGGEWIIKLGDVGAGKTLHYYILNEDGKIFLTLAEIPAPEAIGEGNTGIGDLLIYGGGTLPVGTIEWKVLGTY